MNSAYYCLTHCFVVQRGPGHKAVSTLIYNFHNSLSLWVSLKTIVVEILIKTFVYFLQFSFFLCISLWMSLKTINCC